MTARRTIPLGLAGCALAAVAAPAWAHPEPPAEPGAYEYAQPESADAPVIYREGEVVQPLPGEDAPPPPRPDDLHAHDHAHTAGHGHGHGYAEAPLHPHGEHVPMQPPHGAQAYHAMPPYPYQAHHAPPQPAFEHERWLADCRERLGDRRGRDEDGVGAGILGAIVGGVIGNRVASGERLAGTLIGAGVGGLAGVAIGSAIGAAARDRDDDRVADECELYLDDYLAGYGRHPGYGYGHPQAYGYGHPVHMTYVPVLVMVPQRAVIRETVTEEWIDAPAPARRTIHHHAPPAPAKKAKRIKAK
jgi:hypothetical protein